MDALRLTLAALCAQGKEMRLSVQDIEGYKKFLNKLWNAARFALMNLDLSPGPSPKREERPPAFRDSGLGLGPSKIAGSSRA
jgi:valyl-tRNA synthetase